MSLETEAEAASEAVVNEVEKELSTQETSAIDKFKAAYATSWPYWLPILLVEWIFIKVF